MQDSDMLSRIAQGDRGAFSDYYRLHQKRLTAYAMAILAGDKEAAEDVVDEAFLDLWKNAAKYSARGNAMGWIRRVVRNKAVDWLRKFGDQKVDLQAQSGPVEIDDSPDPEQQAASLSDAEWLKTALAQLSLQHREVVQLFYYEELPLADIAVILDCPANTIKTRLHYARKKLYAQHHEMAV